jgi:hypothetical protein
MDQFCNAVGFFEKSSFGGMPESRHCFGSILFCECWFFESTVKLPCRGATEYRLLPRKIDTAKKYTLLATKMMVCGASDKNRLQDLWLALIMRQHVARS